MRIQVINTVTVKQNDKKGGTLPCNRCRYLFDDNNLKHGYRFMWFTADGKMVPARGQTRIHRSNWSMS